MAKSAGSRRRTDADVSLNRFDCRAATLQRAAFAALFACLLSMPVSITVPFVGTVMGDVAMARDVMAREDVIIETDEGPVTIVAEMAITPREQARGLMFRTELAERAGMLFLYEEQEITMWMANTPLSLDMIFIRADGTVHRIARRTEPLSREVIPSNGDVTAVLEIRGGQARALGIQVGDTVRHRHFGTAR